jgi:DNA-directed RNA polymerase sigma subunit (sigma70/sigma32)
MAGQMSDPTPRPPRRGRVADERRREEEADDAAVKALRQRLSGVLRRLPDIERRVLELRMGLVDGVPAKPGQVAERLGLTIAEVKRIEARAFERIREVGPIKGLEKFLER